MTGINASVSAVRIRVKVSFFTSNAIYDLPGRRPLRSTDRLLASIKTAEMFEAVDWLGDLPQQTWPKATRPVELRHFDVILLKSTAAILAAATFVGDRTTASTSLAGADAMVLPTTSWYHQSN